MRLGDVVYIVSGIPKITVKGLKFAVLKFRGFLDGDLSRGFNFADFEFLN